MKEKKQTRIYLRFLIPVLMFILVLSLFVLPPANAASVTISVNTGTTYQTLDGFGAAVSWSQGTLTEHPYKIEIYDLLFNQLGLDIYRFRNQYRNVAGFDYETTEIVKMANASLGKNIKLLCCSWTPPADLKSNNNLNQGTLIKENGAYVYSKFADYWYNALVAYKAKGIVPDYISIQNEPDYENSGWETCVLRPTEDTTYAGYGPALNAVVSRIASFSPLPKIVGPECTGLAGGSVPGPLVQNYCNNIDTTKLYAIAHHLYNGGDANNPDSFNTNFQTIATTYSSKPRWQTEYDQGTAFTTASLINNALTVEGVSAYFYWDLIWDTSQRPLIALESPWNKSGWSSTKGYIISDFYYVFKQFCKYTDPGYVRVEDSSSLTEVKTSAFISPDKNQLTVILINNGSAENMATLNLNGFTAASSAIYRTIPGGSDKFASAGSLGSGNTVTLPAQSVSTVVLRTSSYSPPPTPAPLPTLVPPPASRSAFAQIEAETYNSMQGIQTAMIDDNGNRCVGYIEPYDYITFNNVDFGTGATGFQASVASGTSGGNIEVHLDSNGGPLVGTIPCAGTGDWGVWQTVSGTLSGATGVHNLYLVFTGSSGYLINIDWFKFTGGNATPTPTIPTVTATPTPTRMATPTPTRVIVDPTPTTPRNLTPTRRSTPTRRVRVTPTRRVTPTPTSRQSSTPTQRVTPTPTTSVTPTPTSRPSSTPTRANTPTPTTYVPGEFVITYVIQSDWGNGATISVTLINNTTAAVNGWTLAFTFPGNQTIANLWNGTYTQSGASVSVKDAGFNGVIGALGGSVNFGFNLNYSGTNAKP
ncbi:MAG TPA: carbohydrate-binding protein, partial [Bacillota bacterium]|nr:carbohydrate-binding protein [Bacillota bacterium]